MVAFPTQNDYWDAVADKKGFTTPFQMELFRQYVAPESSILDVGCGYGRTLSELYNQGYTDLCGVDFSAPMIRRGRERYPHLSLCHHPDAELPFPDNHFDAVILLAVLTCIADDAAQTFLLKELRRVLKPGGVLYINDFLLNQDQRNVDRYERFEKVHGQYGIFQLDEGAVLRHHTEERVRELTAPFRCLHYAKTVYRTMNGHTSNGFYFLGRKT